MNWFFKWLYNGLKSIEQEEHNTQKVAEGPRVGLAMNIPRVRAGSRQGIKVADDGQVNLSQSPLVFRIYPATGGHIVEYSYYNEKKDTNDQALHLIPSDLDLGTELAKIMTLEALKR